MASYAALRGIYSADEEQLETFREGVPIFESVSECMEWVHENAQYGSNPDDPRLKHIFTHLFDWSQVQRHIVPKIELKANPFNHEGEDFYYKHDMSADDDGNGSDVSSTGNRPSTAVHERVNRAYEEEEFAPVREYLQSRLELPIHRVVNITSTMNSLTYLFNHMRCGIAVVIRDNQLALFAPFVNKDYVNNWGQYLNTDPPDMDEYFRLKRKYYRPENIIRDKMNWWANGNIICNEHHAPREPFTHYWGDNLLPTFKHMLECLCRERKIPDVDFFFNKRDHPQLKADLTEPYDFVFDSRDTPLTRERHESYAPILSFYTSPRFADIPVPTTEDWESAVGKVFPPSFIPDYRNQKISEPRDLYLKDNFEKFHCSWENKVNTAFFRGNATGGGTTPETNQRIHIANLCKRWNEDGSNGSKPPLLDAGVTGFNVRDKKLFGDAMRFTMFDRVGLEKATFVEMYKQGTYKYILYIEGHCAANRYSFLMRLGSVILKVESKCEASEMWFFPLLKPYVSGEDGEDGVGGADHVSIKSDLSDLREKIEWCRQNDDKCRQIAENAKERYDRCLSRDSLLDYMQMVMVNLAKNFEHPPSWWAMPEALGARPNFAPSEGCARDQKTREFVLCTRCEREIDNATDNNKYKRRNSSNEMEQPGKRPRGD